MNTIMTLRRAAEPTGLVEAASEKLFSYGTLQQETVQIETFGRVLRGQDDAMPGFRLDVVEITDAEVIRKSGKRFHPIVLPSQDPNDEVAGTVFAVTRGRNSTGQTPMRLPNTGGSRLCCDPGKAPGSM